MAGGKKQKVTGFTQAEQELLAVSVEKYSMDEKSKRKFLKSFSEKNEISKNILKNFLGL